MTCYNVKGMINLRDKIILITFIAIYFSKIYLSYTKLRVGYSDRCCSRCGHAFVFFVLRIWHIVWLRSKLFANKVPSPSRILVLNGLDVELCVSNSLDRFRIHLESNRITWPLTTTVSDPKWKLHMPFGTQENIKYLR